MKVKPAVRPFHRDGVAHAHTLGQGVGVVAQAFDDEAQMAIAAPRRGDGEGVRALPVVQRHKRKLPGFVPRPAGLELSVHLQHVQVGQGVHGGDLARHLPVCAHAAQQHPDGGVAATSHQQGHDQTEPGGPILKLHQHHRMRHQRQIGHGNEVVGFEEPAVGQAFDQRQHHEQHSGVKRPLAHALGPPALGGQPLLHTALGQHRARATHGARQPAQTHRPFGALSQQPVAERQHQTRNAQPLVQAVHLVEAAQAGLQPHGAQRQPHGHAHHTNAQHTAVLHEHGAPGKEMGQGRPLGGVGQPPEGREGQQKYPEEAFDGCHVGQLMHPK